MYFSSRKALVVAVLSCALIASFASSSSADSKDDLERQKKGVSGKIGDAKKDLAHSSKAYSRAASALDKAQGSLDAAQSHLSSTRGQLAVAQAKDVQMQAALTASEAELKKAKAELSDGEKSLNKSEIQVKQFTLETLQEGDRGLRAFGDLLRGASPTDFSEQMSLNNSVGDAQIAKMQSLEATRVMLRLNRDKVRKLRDQVAAKRKEAALNLATKKVLEAQAAVETAQVTQLVGARATAAKSANAAKRVDAKQLQQLESDRDSLAARLRALAAKENKSGGKGSGGDKGGALSYPANGPITSKYGMRFHPVLHRWKLHDGTDFGIPCGTRVRAAAGGTVVDTYYNGGYGNRVIINHGMKRGKNIVTTYNHLSRDTVHPGEKVKRGETIAYSGTTGYSTGCHLHFMVLANGGTTNPMNWL